ncbi:hypothetical protein XH99_12920 [Bradyrhizobium nanningense]|uniref:Uncharacterized protein n=1 Tax=Bradyrhizobium nanningense TaxID=1325118 RepID=A0A4Q0S6T6_9BRAD|nr:hypothetical protein XH99_12920 [Bradyrhizobium nanningense]
MQRPLIQVTEAKCTERLVILAYIRTLRALSPRFSLASGLLRCNCVNPFDIAQSAHDVPAPKLSVVSAYDRVNGVHALMLAAPTPPCSHYSES